MLKTNKKTALITGISGMVGSHLADYLIENTDWDIVGLIRWRSSLENIGGLARMSNSSNRVKFIYGDLTDATSIKNSLENFNFDFVFHLAAQSFPKTSFDSPLQTYDVNILGTSTLLETIKNTSPKAIIHVCSSSEVFGRVPKEKIPIKEDCAFHPASPYAISKVGTDLIGRFYSEAYGMNIMTTRMFTHTGPRRGDVFAESSFAKQIALAEAGYQDPMIKVGNLDSLRTVADVRDAVRAYYMLVTVNPIPGESYNIGGTHTLTVREILEYLISISTLSKKIKFSVDKDRLRPIDADLQLPSTEKFTKHTGWMPEISFEKTMNDLLNYWRDKVAKSGNVFLVR